MSYRIMNLQEELQALEVVMNHNTPAGDFSNWGKKSLNDFTEIGVYQITSQSENQISDLPNDSPIGTLIVIPKIDNLLTKRYYPAQFYIANNNLYYRPKPSYSWSQIPLNAITASIAETIEVNLQNTDNQQNAIGGERLTP